MTMPLRAKRFLAAAVLATAMVLHGGPIAVIAHRGWWQSPNAGGAQNSLAALKAAQDAGFWGAEFDIHMTVDEVVVVRHDNQIRGTNIWQHVYADIAETRLPNGERMPTLDEYLAQGAKCRTTMLVMEIKPEGYAANAASAPRACRLADLGIEGLRRHGLLSTNRVMFISFSNDACRHIAEKLPGFRVECLTAQPPENVRAKGISGIDFEQSSYATHAEYVQVARQLGMTVGAWTVDSTNQINRAINWGLDAITSNYPDRVRDLLRTAGVEEATIPQRPDPTIFMIRGLADVP